MGLLENNLSPYLTAVEGTTPASPAAGQQRLFVRSSDHVLCRVNSSGVVVPIETASLGLPLGLTGAVSPTRYVGGTASVAPTTGTFAVGDFVITAVGGIYICTVAGSPGTWVSGVSGELDYVQFTSAVTPTATTEATANTVVTGSAVTYDGSTAVWIEFWCESARPDTGGAGRYITWVLYDGASSIGLIGGNTTPAAADDGKPTTLKRRLTPSAGAHTYSIRAFVSSGTAYIGAGVGGVGAYVPGYIRIARA